MILLSGLVPLALILALIAVMLVPGLLMAARRD